MTTEKIITEESPIIMEIEFTPNLKIYYDSLNHRLEVFRDGVYQPDIVEVEIPKLSNKAVTGEISDLMVKLTCIPLISGFINCNKDS